MINNELLGELLKTPLMLLAIKDQDVINQLNSIIPYSSAFEIECEKSPIFGINNFKLIPDIINVNCDSSEQRYRIPNGLRGIICLYNICDQLRYNSLLNRGSGIHYHINCTENVTDIHKEAINPTNKSWILRELDSWNYQGTFNKRDIGSGHYWIRLSSKGTLEFRLGEMTFDFNLILKRITHCNSIVRRLKDQLSIPLPTYEPIDAKKIIAYRKSLLNGNLELQAKIAAINEKIAKLDAKLNADSQIDLEQIRSMYRNRLHKVVKPSK